MKRLARVLAASVLLVPTLLAPAPATATATATLAQFEANDAWWFKAMHVGEVHKKYTGKGVKVAVIDGSIDLTVPELRGANIRLGRSVTDKKSVSVPGAGAANHGTAMTVLIAGQGNGGVTGLAPDAEVTFYQAHPDPYKDELENWGELIRQAGQDGADIISVSLADSDSSVYDYAVEEVIKEGAVVVAGAGSAGDRVVRYPAALSGVVAVGALDRNIKPWTKQPGQRDKTSSTLSILAPGVEVPAGAASRDMRGALWTPAFPRTGTSPATAITAGALALVKQKYPDATGNQLVQHLIHTTGRTDGKPYYEWRRAWGFGTVGLRAMLAKDPTGWPDENPLMKGPVHAIETYPLSVYRDPNAPPPSPTTTSNAETDTTNTKNTDDTAGPLPWALGGAALLLILTTGVVLARRRSRTPEEA